MSLVYLQLGSNLGDRLSILNTAVSKISTQVGDLLLLSEIYQSSPWGVEGQGDFLNQVILIESSYSAKLILEIILNIEKELGRVRIEKWGERVIDIDILFYNDEIIEASDLCVPHKYISKRKFVLLPLNEIAPNFIHPKYDKTITQLLAECLDEESVMIYEV